MIYSCIIICVFLGKSMSSFHEMSIHHPSGKIRETRFLSALELVVGGAWGDLDGDFPIWKKPHRFLGEVFRGENDVSLFFPENFVGITPTLLGTQIGRRFFGWYPSRVQHAT